MEKYNDESTKQKLASEAVEMLAQIGAACMHVVRGCEEAQKEPEPLQVLLSLRELEYALGELHANSTKLRERVEGEWPAPSTEEAQP